MATTAVLRHRRDTAVNWTSNNPVLQAGQLGYETDTLKFKFGNGSTTWISLSYAAAVSGISDGDKGDIVVSGSGATWTVDTGVITTSKMGGDVTTAGKALLDDADATAQRVTLGLGSIATQNANAVSITGGTLTGVIVSTGAFSSNVNESLMRIVRKSTAGTITKGQALYVVGSTGTHFTVELADASVEATAATAIGIAAETITNTTSGYMIIGGLLDGLSTLPTASFTDGAILWLSETAGGLTTTRPTQPAHGVAMGWVINASNGAAGSAYIKVINGQELNELHDVLIISATANNVLMYDSVSSVWKNRSAGYLSTLITGFASASHAHSTGDITSGIFAPSFLGSGSPSSTNFLRGDGSWALPSGGGGVAVAAGTQTGTSGTINFANSNGITFGMSGSNQITASYTVPTQSVQTQASGNIAGAGFSSTTTAGINIVGTNNSLGLSLGVPVYLTTQTVQTQASGNIARTGFSSTTTNGTAIVGTLNTGGLSLGIPAYLTTQSVQTQVSGNIAGAGFTSTTTVGTAIVGTQNSLGLSLGVPAYLTAAIGGGGVALGASTQTAISGTVNFANSNGISFGMSGSSQITASHNGITTQTVQTQASGAIAGTGFTTATTAGSVITGALGTNGLNLGIPAYLTAAGGGGAINVSAGTTSNNLQTLVFSNNGNGVSFGLNGSTVTASVAPQLTLSGYNHYNDVVQSIGAVGQGSLIFDPVDLANAVQFDNFALMMYNSNATNSSGSHTVSFWIGLYTQNVSTLSLLGSTSTTVGATHSGTVGSYSLYSGIRKLNIPFTTTLSQGAYFLGHVSRTTSGGANGTYNNVQQSNVNSDYRGLWGSAINSTNQAYRGAGYYSATTTGLPGSVEFSQIQGTAAAAFRPPVIIFQSGNY